MAGGMSGLLGEGDKAQLLESYFWVGSAFRRAGPLGMEGSAFQRAGSLGVVEGEDKEGGQSGEGRGRICGDRAICLPQGQLGGCCGHRAIFKEFKMWLLR